MVSMSLGFLSNLVQLQNFKNSNVVLGMARSTFLNIMLQINWGMLIKYSDESDGFSPENNITKCLTPLSFQ